MTILLVVLIVIAFLCGAELFAIMIAATALGAYSSPRDFFSEFDGFIQTLFGTGTGDQATILSTIPMFIYMGYVLAESKTADRLVRFANALLGWMPGGLAIVTISTCALFTTFTGASGVTIVALGGVLMPALVRQGYPKRFSMGMLAGTGSVGLLFPPALPLFVYGTVYGLTTVGTPYAADWETMRFALAGIVPGIVLVMGLSAVAVAVAWKLPRQKFELGELGRSFVAALPELAIPFGVIALIAIGFAPLHEIAALTVIYVIVLETLILRMIKPRVLWEISREAFVMVGAIFIIILTSSAFTNYLVTQDVPQKLVAWTTQYVSSDILFLLTLNILLLIVGMMMDIFSAIVIVVPLIAPIARHYGIDPYHLGVIFLLNLEVGYLTPPVGLNLFITSLKFETPVPQVVRATLPFLLAMIVVLGIVTYVPALTIYPEAERTGPVDTLVQIVRDGVETSQITATEIALVDALGNPLAKDGKPVVRKFRDCTPIKDEIQRNNCRQLFYDYSACVPDPKKQDAKQKQCANEAIAAWTVKELNGDLNDLEKAIITVNEVTMIDPESGEVMKNASGAPVVKRLAKCGPLTDSDRERCLSLFIEVSSCHIKPHDVAECVEEKAQDCPPDAVESCTKERTLECRKPAIEECAADAIKTWAEDHPDHASQE